MRASHEGPTLEDAELERDATSIWHRLSAPPFLFESNFSFLIKIFVFCAITLAALSGSSYQRHIIFQNRWKHFDLLSEE